MNVTAILVCLILLLVANGAPIVVRNLYGERFAWPVDFARRFPDGHPILGPAKTWRGVAAAVVATAAAAPLLALSPVSGALFGLCAMVGDALSSFLKRRMALKSNANVLGLDQLPESLLPAVCLQGPLGLDGGDIIIVVVAFLALEIVVSPVLYKLRIRR